jgi:hypothetical protein
VRLVRPPAGVDAAEARGRHVAGDGHPVVVAVFPRQARRPRRAGHVARAQHALEGGGRSRAHRGRAGADGWPIRVRRAVTYRRAMPGIRYGVVLAAVVLAGCGGDAEAPSAGGPVQTPERKGKRSPLERVQEIVDTKQGSVELTSHKLDVDIRSLSQIEKTPLPAAARGAGSCRSDGRSFVLSIPRAGVDCYDRESNEDYFYVALFERAQDAEDQANLFGEDDVPAPSNGMPKETVCTTGGDGSGREGIVYCDLLVNGRVLLGTHSENGRSRQLMGFAYDWLRSAG